MSLITNAELAENAITFYKNLMTNEEGLVLLVVERGFEGYLKTVGQPHSLKLARGFNGKACALNIVLRAISVYANKPGLYSELLFLTDERDTNVLKRYGMRLLYVDEDVMLFKRIVPRVDEKDFGRYLSSLKEPKRKLPTYEEIMRQQERERQREQERERKRQLEQERYYREHRKRFY